MTKLRQRLNIVKVMCSCGKEIEEYDAIYGNRLRHFGYPETHCHCNCGVRWGEHLKSLSVSKK